jgi:hypothetical protein
VAVEAVEAVTSNRSVTAGVDADSIVAIDSIVASVYIQRP